MVSENEKFILPSQGNTLIYHGKRVQIHHKQKRYSVTRRD